MSRLVASDGPLFSTVMREDQSVPLATLPGPVLVMTRSATGMTSVGSVSELLLGSGSGSLPVTVAVLAIVPVVSESTVTSMVTDCVAPAARVADGAGKAADAGRRDGGDGDARRDDVVENDAGGVGRSVVGDADGPGEGLTRDHRIGAVGLGDLEIG